MEQDARGESALGGGGRQRSSWGRRRREDIFITVSDLCSRTGYPRTVPSAEEGDQDIFMCVS
eukprot:746848-Hanusia_phi.AAC.2